MKTATLEKIGLSLNVTKQAVSKEFVKKGLLIKNNSGSIDIEEPTNRNFLKSKNADFSVFYPKKVSTKDVKKKPAKKNRSIKKENSKNDSLEDSATKKASDISNDLYKIDVATKMERFKAIQKDNELKDIRLAEEKGRLIDRALVQHVVMDTIGIISQTIQSEAHAIVDEVISVVLTDPDKAREKVIKIIRSKLSAAMRKAIEESEKISRKKKLN